MQITVRAGEFEIVAGYAQRDKDHLIIEPPETTMLVQLQMALAKRYGKPRRTRSDIALAGGITLLALRWGTWLAVLSDPQRPLDTCISDGTLSRITDGEMKRIQIEASSNLAQLIALQQSDAEEFTRLVYAAWAYLPGARWLAQSRLRLTEFPFETLFQMARSGGLETDAVSTAVANRLLTNTLVNLHYRNGVEDLHAGRATSYHPEIHARLTANEISEIVQRAARWGRVFIDQPWRSSRWEIDAGLLRQIPLLGAPDGWSLTAQSAAFNLPVQTQTSGKRPPAEQAPVQFSLGANDRLSATDHRSRGS